MTALIQIYNDNKKDSSINMVPTNSAPSEELISAAESAAAMVQHNLQTDFALPDNRNNNPNISKSNVDITQNVLHSERRPPTSTITSAQTSLAHQQQSVLHPTMDLIQSANTVIQHAGAGSILSKPGVLPERFRNVEVVSTQLRNQIKASKDINLALLLIPNNESTSEYRRVNSDGVEYVMKPGNSRLAKSLTLGEFIMAFSKYKNIVCDALPNRRIELDQYERDIVEMATQFGGTRFYDNHKAFSACNHKTEIFSEISLTVGKILRTTV